MLDELNYLLLIAGIDILCAGAIGTAYFISESVGFPLAFPIGIILTLRLYDKLKERFIDRVRI